MTRTLEIDFGGASAWFLGGADQWPAKECPQQIILPPSRQVYAEVSTLALESLNGKRPSVKLTLSQLHRRGEQGRQGPKIGSALPNQ